MELVVGILAGVVSGIGMGGGTVLIAILTTFLGIEQQIAQASNIIYFAAAAPVAIYINMRNKLINWKIGLPFIAFGIVGALIGANITLKIETELLKKFFGIFLLLIAFYEMFSLYNEYKTKKKSNNMNIE